MSDIPTNVTKQWLDGYFVERFKAAHGGMTPEENAARFADQEKKINQLLSIESAIAHEKELALTPKAYQNQIAQMNDPYKGQGLFAMRCVRLLGAKTLKMYDETPQDFALKQWNDRGTADAVDRIIQVGKSPEVQSKALASQINTDGGFLLTEEYTATIIPLLRAQSVLYGRMNRMPTMALSGRQPRHSTAVSATWVGENIETNASQGALDDVAWSLKKLSIIQAASNDLLRMGGVAVDQWLRDDMVTSARLRFDLSLLRGLGTAYEPKGVRYAIAAANIAARTQAAATSTLAEIVHDLYDMLEDVEGSNVDPSGSIWIGPSRTKNGLAQLLDGNGNFVFASQLNSGTLLGYPMGISNQIPKNLGGGDETEHMFIPLKEWLFVEGQMMQIRAYEGAAYRDSGGTMVSGVAADQTTFRLNMYGDVQPYHEEAGSVRTAIDWGT